MTDQKSIFHSFELVSPGTWPVKGIGTQNEPLQVHGHGEIKIRSRVNGVWHNGKIQDVLYVPNLGVNLFSIGAAADRGITITKKKR